LIGQNAFLQVMPAYLYDLRLYQSGANEQRSGMGLAFNDHSTPSITPTFSVALNQPTTRLYLRLSGVSARITQLKLLSAESLRDEQQRDGFLKGFYFGAMLLMFLLTLFNWAWTRDRIYRSYTGFLASTIVFFLLSNGFATAYVLKEQPLLAMLLLKFCVSWVVASTIFFSLLIMQVDQHQPRLARGMRWLGYLLLVSNLFIVQLHWMPRLMQINAACHLITGLLLLAVCARQAWNDPSPRSLLLFASYLVFTLLDKYPLLPQLGFELVQITEWAFDTRKVGYLFQLLPMHLLIVAKLLEQKKLKSESDSLAKAANQEARAAHLQRSELNRFLGMLGHEIRTPLTVIDSAVQSLELQPGANEPDRLSRHTRIRQAVKQLDRLVSDTMLRERIESSGWQLQWTRWSANDLIDVVLLQYELELPAAPLSAPYRFPLRISGQPGWLELTVSDDISGFEGDLHLLQIALCNLLDNACKYADAGSTVKLQVRLLPPAGAMEVASMRIDVLSCGPVLTTEELTQVFDKYWRRDEHQNLGGTGLGLPLVRHIMRLHAGNAEAQSLPERWTCFSLQMPLRRA